MDRAAAQLRVHNSNTKDKTCNSEEKGEKGIFGKIVLSR